MCVVALVACDRAPHGVIKESKMKELLIDIHKAQAYIELHPDAYPDDSSKQVLKQSVFEKHHITQADYDTSLMWYAHNIEIYNNVYRKVILELQHEQKKLAKDVVAGLVVPMSEEDRKLHKRYSAKGDTADVWQGDRLWLLTHGLQQGYVKFDVKPDVEYRQGDRYQLNAKLLGFGTVFTIFLGVDYDDGSTSFVNRTNTFSGWFALDLQTDSAKHVHRIYGYMRYETRPATVAFVDSVQLLRTHIDHSKYDNIGSQKLISRNGTAIKKPVNTPSNHYPAADEFQRPQRSYAPKPVENVRSRSPHRGNKR